MTALADMTPEQRSAHMALVRGRDTRPELIVRGILDAADVAHATHVESLPGTPDIVVASSRTVVFVHGCFWHRHGCRKSATKIRKNREFWAAKFARNVERDEAAARSLRTAGWRVMVVWECETRNLKRLIPRLLKRLAPTRRKCAHGPHVAEAGRVLCDHCARYNRERIRFGESSRRRPREPDSELAARRVLLKLCRECGLPAPDGRRRCHACGKNKPTGKTARWITRRHDKGLCRCGTPFQPGKRRCPACLKQLREDAKRRSDRRRAKGQCVHCGNPARKGNTLCEKHLQRIRRSNRRRARALKAS